MLKMKLSLQVWQERMCISSYYTRGWELWQVKPCPIQTCFAFVDGGKANNGLWTFERFIQTIKYEKQPKTLKQHIKVFNGWTFAPCGVMCHQSGCEFL